MNNSKQLIGDATKGRNWNKNFAVGYRDGLKGPEGYRAQLFTYPGYVEGWDAGNSDRPSLDDLTLDVASERSNPLGY